jgi:hypothetical protein
MAQQWFTCTATPVCIAEEPAAAAFDQTYIMADSGTNLSQKQPMSYSLWEKFEQGSRAGPQWLSHPSSMCAFVTFLTLVKHSSLYISQPS